MSLLLKDPGAALDYSVDWGAEYLADDVLSASNWSVSPEEADGLRIVASSADLLVATVEVIGGAPGKIYRLTNHVTMLSGREDSRSLMVRVEKR